MKRRKAFRGKDSRLANEPGDPSRRAGPIIHHPSSLINPRGFTLIELLVVIGIIALLMAILFPALSRARGQAKAMVCQTRLRQWGMTLNMYAQDNGGRFPCDGGGSAGAWLLRGMLLGASATDPNAPQDSLHHFRTKDIACCPVATKSLPPERIVSSSSGSLPGTSNLMPMAANGIPGSEFPAWVVTGPGPQFVGSYGVNNWLFTGGGFGSPVAVRRRFLTVDIFSLKSKGNIPMLLDSVAPSGRLQSAPPPAERSAANHFCIDRHDGCVNGLLLDWSVRRIGLKELWTLKWNKDFDTNGRWTKAGGVKPEQWPKWMRRFRD
jgi:prepilin-type N-terminal cleavage/methylation domain-containing protein